MTRNQVSTGFVVLAMVAAGLACGFSASTARITDAYLSADPDGNEAAEVFFPEETFYLIVDLANAPDSTEVEATWVAVDVEGVDPETEIDSAALTSGDGRLTFDLTNDDLWPVGRYRVDVYLNGDLERSLEFEVQ
jgi:hypothetical protein